MASIEPFPIVLALSEKLSKGFVKTKDARQAMNMIQLLKPKK